MTRSSRDKTNFKVGLFVISLFLVLSATAIFLAVQKRPVGSAQVFQLSTQSASGLTVGMPLFYSGFEVGELTSLTLTRAGTVQVEVEVLEEHQFRINKTSVFSLEQPLIGMTRLNVKTEDLNARAAEPSHVFGLVTANEMNAIMADLPLLIQKVDALASNLNTLTSEGSSLDSGLKNLNEVSYEIAQKRGAEVLLGEDGGRELQASMAALNDVLTDASKLIATSNGVLASADKKLLGDDGTVEKVNNILDDLQQKLVKLDGLIVNLVRLGERVDETTEDLPVLREDIDVTVDSANQLLRDIRNVLPMDQKKDIPLP